MGLSEHWEREAEAWARWAREPGHDAYWDFSGPAFPRAPARPGTAHARPRLRRGPARPGPGRARPPCRGRGRVSDRLAPGRRGTPRRRLRPRRRVSPAVRRRVVRPGRRLQLADGHRRPRRRAAGDGARARARRAPLHLHRAPAAVGGPLPGRGRGTARGRRLSHHAGDGPHVRARRADDAVSEPAPAARALRARLGGGGLPDRDAPRAGRAGPSGSRPHALAADPDVPAAASREGLVVADRGRPGGWSEVARACLASVVLMALVASSDAFAHPDADPPDPFRPRMRRGRNSARRCATV